MHFKRCHMTRRGSAIIMALVTMVVLLVLGLAVATVSLGTLKNNVVDAANNDAFYAAESAVTSAIEQLKYEVSSYYTQMLEAQRSEYAPLFANFFSGINGNAQLHFAEPVFEDVTTQTAFSTGSFDNTESICEFLISCTATAADGSEYRVDGKLYVKKVDVSTSGGVWLEMDDAAYKVGGTLKLLSGFGVYDGGDVITSVFSNPNKCYYSVEPPGILKIQPSTINNCLTYPSYTTPTISNPDVYVTVNNTILKNGSFPTNRPVTIVSAPGVSFKIDGSTSIYPGSVVYSRGNLTASPSMTATSPITCYCDGNFIASNGPVYANVYARGNVTTSGNFHGTIYCDGSATIGNSFHGTVISGSNLTLSGGLNGSFYAAGQININNGDQGNAVIYAGTKIVLGSGNYQNVVLFSGGDIDITGGSSLTGAIIAKGNVNQNAWLTLTYSSSVIQAIRDNLPQNEFFFSGGGEAELDEEVFMGQSITAQGRQS